MDWWDIVKQIVNVPAMVAGIAVAVGYLYAAPGPLDAEGNRMMKITPGTFWSRIQPFIGPTVAFLATIGVEWHQSHPEIGGMRGLMVSDVVRGLTTAFGCEYAFRVYFKTLKGV